MIPNLDDPVVCFRRQCGPTCNEHFVPDFKLAVSSIKAPRIQYAQVVDRRLIPDRNLLGMAKCDTLSDLDPLSRILEKRNHQQLAEHVSRGSGNVRREDVRQLVLE